MITAAAPIMTRSLPIPVPKHLRQLPQHVAAAESAEQWDLPWHPFGWIRGLRLCYTAATPSLRVPVLIGCSGAAHYTVRWSV